MTEKNQLVKATTLPPILSTRIEKTHDIFLCVDLFTQAQRAAELLSKSTLVPDQYRNNMPNCFVALATARLLDIDIFAFLQNSYVIHGRPGIEAKLKIAMINTRGPFKGPIQWRIEGEGNGRQCTAYAIHGETGELCEATVTWAMVVAERWNQKPGSKWNTLPDLMFRYRSASFLGNLYCPEVTMGMKTVEELEDIDMHQIANGTYAATAATEKILGKEKTEEPVENQEPTAAELAKKTKQTEDAKKEKQEKAKAAAAKKEKARIKKEQEEAKAKAAAAKKEASEAEQEAGEDASGEELPGEEPPIEEGEILDEPAEDFGWV